MLARLKEIMFTCRYTMAHATIYYDNNACFITEQILEGAPPVHTEDRGMETFHSAG